MRLHDPLHGRQACPKFIAFDQKVGQICPRQGLFSCRSFSKRGQICYIPYPPPQSLNLSKLYHYTVLRPHVLNLKLFRRLLDNPTDSETGGCAATGDALPRFLSILFAKCSADRHEITALELHSNHEQGMGHVELVFKPSSRV